MGKLEYAFYINYETLIKVQEIAHAGVCSKNFLEDLDALVEDAKLRPNKDLHWDVSRLLSLYYSPELVVLDKTFGAIHTYLLNLWRKTLELSGEDIKTPK